MEVAEANGSGLGGIIGTSIEVKGVTPFLAVLISTHCDALAFAEDNDTEETVDDTVEERKAWCYGRIHQQGA